MSDNNKKEEKKGGAIPGILGSGSSAGGASGFGASGIGSSGSWLSGLFATKAGIVGMVLGGATIAAGVGVVYNFIGPSSKSMYSPDLFQNTYYEEEASKAGQERSMSRDASAAASSTLDMFREQARKDGLSLGAEGGGSASGEAADPQDSSADASAEAPDVAAQGGGDAGAGAGGGAKLQKHSGFGGGGGGSGTSIPRMQAGGGLSGGIGGQFQPVYRPPAQANAGTTSGMTASAARMKNAPKYAVPNINKKGAYGQAKFAGKMGAKAAYPADGAGARTAATEAFSGETSGSGDVGTPGSGAGLGGAGVSNGPNLKGNDPSLNSNESTPPKVPDPEDVDPWQEYEDMAMNGMMWALGMIIVTKLLSNLAKKATIPWLMAALYMAAVAAAIVAIGFAARVIYAGFKMFSEFDQKMMGGIYMLTGVMLMLKALEALGTAASGAANTGSTTTTTNGVTTVDAAGANSPAVLGGTTSNIMGGIGSFGSSFGGIMNGL